MKKFLKFFAIAMLIVPCAFAFAGCGKKKNKDHSEEYYAKLVSLVTSDNKVSNSSFVYTEINKSEHEVTRTDNKALTNEEKAKFEGQARKTVVAYDKTTNQGYSIDYSKVGDEFVTEGYINDYVVVDGETYKLIHYGQGSSGSIVDAEYASHTFVAEKAVADNDYLALISTCKTLKSIKDAYDVQQVEAEIKVVKNGSEYVLTMEAEEATNGAYQKIEIHYTDEHILSAKIISTYLDSEESVDGEEGVFYKDKETETTDISVKFELTTEDKNRIPTDLLSSVEGQELTNRQVSVDFVLDGESHSRQLVFGADFVVPEGIIAEHTTVTKWYLDETMTQEFTADKVPSYDITLYGKSTPDDGYAIIITKTNMADIIKEVLSVEVVEVTAEDYVLQSALQLPATVKIDVVGAVYNASTKSIKLTNKAYVVVTYTTDVIEY